MEIVTSADATPIAFERSGEGPVLILVGGAFNDRGSAMPLAEHLEPRFTVVRYDRRGRGDSGDNPLYDVAREIEDLAALADTVGGRPGLFGLSSGGALALRAVAAGVPVSRVAVYEVPFVPDEDEAREHAARRAEAVRALLDEDRRGDAVVEFLTGIGLPPEMAQGMRHAPMFPALEAIAHTLPYDHAAIAADGDGTIPAGLIGGITLPALVACGGASPEPMRQVARRLAELLPDGRLAELEGQTHDAAPDVLASALTSFFEG
ncbi:alpha/beta fold hydrolase [Actinomadura sp. LD22]|uniref:Alpha/beta fold hydrolase n=1 Tax=Actinomadura physcomitrii TaxID=2650748 RepID=A0A6I4M5E7_9ACTN|nr:alpha/beta hydrolase [Actinomadura physcomitrii]MWA00290.1 alpha/beta fold hydrolase [Actinomadura physcomitrii]